MILVAVSLRILRSGSLPNVHLAGQDVGALSEDELSARVAEIAREREGEEILVRRHRTENDPVATRSYERGQLGYDIDVDATVEEILERGEQANPVASFADQFRASLGSIEMDPIVTFDQERFEKWVRRVQRELATDASEGAIEFRGDTFEARVPEAGLAIDLEGLRDVARDAVLADDETEFTAPVEVVEPEMTRAELRRASRAAEELVSESVTLVSGDDRTVIPPARFGRALEAENVERDGELKVEFSVDAKRLRRSARSAFARLEQPAVDATFTLSGGRVRVVPGRPGAQVDVTKLAGVFLDIAFSEDRTAPAPIEKKWPEFSTKDARGLHIEEQVSTFTTYHSCCEPRVDNIHRIADIIDGTVVEPGEEFSINGRVGERTTAKGFVGAPAISNGEYVEEVGGGISQFATTIFNATFFGGYDFLEYKAHSYYISRYPMGREATVSWPAPDFKFLNDSDSGIYIDTSYSETSITVTFYGRKERRVESVSGDPHNYTNPPTQCKVNRSLGRGESRVIQTGSRGFDITVTRVFGDGTREDFNTTYLPVPEIVERRKCE